MCGICGVVNLAEREPVAIDLLRRMIAIMRHRGPDEFGVYRDGHAGLGSARLSIIDLATGQQPLSNEDGTLWIVFNGEIFNYVELRTDLEARGHRLRTTSDTEVIVHLFEDRGPQCLEALNGQFAFALWNARERSLFLARDRVGIRPLYYTVADGRFIFGSEMKTILAHPAVPRRLDPQALSQIFTMWAPLSPRTIFEGIREVPPGHYLIVKDGAVVVRPYWWLTYPPRDRVDERTEQECAQQLRSLLIDSVRLQLRADVPVGGYLSGGLDSSIITSIIRTLTDTPLKTFSISFEDRTYDETEHQKVMVAHLGTDHSTVHCTYRTISEAFPEVVWHCEQPILRTAPTPLYLLSALVREHGFKVVLTGEGADEFFAGYNIFKENEVRRFWARQPDSTTRPLLLRRLYGYLPVSKLPSEQYLRGFFGSGLTDTALPHYSHAIRWNNTARIKAYFAPDLHAVLDGSDPLSEFVETLPADFARWDSLSQAQYIETVIFLSGYLLCSQGDRVAMAHSVEGRVPYLDHRVVEFANALPPRFKLAGLREKHILKKACGDLVPPSVSRRPKHPYRAPTVETFFGTESPDYVDEMFSPGAIAAAGYFEPHAVERLVRKCRKERVVVSERDGMAVVGILSTQLVHHLFIESFAARAEAPLVELRTLVTPTARETA